MLDARKCAHSLLIQQKQTGLLKMTSHFTKLHCPVRFEGRYFLMDYISFGQITYPFLIKVHVSLFREEDGVDGWVNAGQETEKD